MMKLWKEYILEMRIPALSTSFTAQNFTITFNNPAGIVTGYWLDGRGLILARGKIFFASPQSPERFWGPLSLLLKRIPEAHSS
jgi:hypothetical protein